MSENVDKSAYRGYLGKSELVVLPLSKKDRKAGRAVGVPKYSPFLIPKLIVNIASGHISIKYGFSGVNYATVSACASANHALIVAADNIKLEGLIMPWWVDLKPL